MNGHPKREGIEWAVSQGQVADSGGIWKVDGLDPLVASTPRHGIKTICLFFPSLSSGGHFVSSWKRVFTGQDLCFMAWLFGVTR